MKRKRLVPVVAATLLVLLFLSIWIVVPAPGAPMISVQLSQCPLFTSERRMHDASCATLVIGGGHGIFVSRLTYQVKRDRSGHVLFVRQTDRNDVLVGGLWHSDVPIM